MERPGGWDKSYVTRSTHVPKPFYWSLHSPELDKIRKESFERGRYYEKILTKEVVKKFDAKSRQDKESFFLDVGGNIGWFSLVAAAHGASKVYMFEPNPANLVRVCESLSLNGWLHEDRGRDVVVPIPKGVSDKASKEHLYRVNSENPGAYSFSNQFTKNESVGEIEMVTLDSFAESRGWFESKPSIGFFKLDVEGYELHVIMGAKKLFKSGLIDLFVMELKEEIEERDKYAMIQVIFNSGYDLYKHGGVLGPTKKVSDKYENYTALAKDIIRRKDKYNLLFRRRGLT